MEILLLADSVDYLPDNINLFFLANRINPFFWDLVTVLKKGGLLQSFRMKLLY